MNSLSQLFNQAPISASRAGVSDNLWNALGMSRTGEGALLPGQGGLAFSPVQNTATNAPVYDWNNNAAASTAAAQMAGAMGAGWSREGVNAFLPGDLNYYDLGGTRMGQQPGGDTDAVYPERDEYRQDMANQLSKLAQKFGYDISGYDLTDGYTPAYSQSAIDQFKALGIDLPAQKKTMEDLYADLNKDLSNFQRIRGASAGWDGKGNMRSTAETLYYQVEPGKWVPISNPVSGRKAEHKGWAREDGAELLTGLSMIMPAFGGWAGLLGHGASGTLSAGAGLGLTSGLGSVIGNGLANTLVNSVMNGVMTGGNPQSILAGLGMSTALQGAGGILGGKNLGDIFNRVPTENYTNISDFLKTGTGQAVLKTPFFRSQEGQGINKLLQAGSRLANSLGA